MSRPRVLVVEDEVEVQNVVGEVLAEEGYEVDAVGTGEAALEAVARNSYDVVISDLGLPGVGGHTLVKEIIHRWPRLARRIIVLTGQPGPTGDSLPVIHKPFMLTDIVEAVEARISAP